MNPRRVLAAAACALTLLASCGSLESPAATIDGVDISNQRVAGEVALYTALFGVVRQRCSTPESGETVTSACARFVLGTLIQQVVFDRYARAHGLSTTPGSVSREAQALASQLGGGAKVAGALAGHDIPQAAFRDLARRIALLRAVQSSIEREQVSDSEILDRYRADIAQYTTIHAEHILVKTRPQAENVYRDVTGAGSTEKDFLDLAKRVSIDPSAKQNSGDLGSLPESGLDPAFVQAALALRQGEISHPVHTQFGWHVIRLVEVSTTPLRDVSHDIALKLGQDRFGAWLDGQLAAAHVSVNPRYGWWDAKKGVLPITSTATHTPIASTAKSPEPGGAASPGVSP